MFECHTCGKHYSRKDFLTRHELNHKNIRPFKCESCNLGFTRRDMLRKHFKSNAHRRVDDHDSITKDIEHSIQPKDNDSFNSEKRPNSAVNGSLDKSSTSHPNNFKKLRIAHFLNDYDEKIYTPPLQPSIIRPSSSSGTLSGGAVDVNFGNLISTDNDPSRAKSNLPGHLRAGKYSAKNGVNENSWDGTPKGFLSLLDMSGGFIDDLLWLFTDNFPDEMLSENNLALHSESAVIDVDATKNFDISPVAYNVSDIHSHMFGHKRFKMNENTRQRLLHLFSDVEAFKDVSLSRLDEYMDLYWFNFAQTFPIIHQVTFDPNLSNIYLLISVLLIGMAHTADRLEYELSVVLNKKFRRILKDVIDENTRLSLPLMQAIILHNFAARNFGDTKLCDMSQIDHGSNLLYLKFSGLLDDLNEPVIHRTKDSTKEELYDQWQNWIYFETCKRTVFLEFICDTQHITFGKLELSAFDIKMELPSSDEVWNASTPEEFFASYQKQPNSLVKRPKLNIHTSKDDYGTPQMHRSRVTRSGNAEDEKLTQVVMERYVHPTSANGIQNNNNFLGKWPSFSWGLKSLMMEYRENQREFSLNCYSLFSRYILLHSLVRVCWNMRGHGLLDLGIVSENKLNDFFKKLEMGFANWKGYFDLHIKLYDDQLKTVDPKNTANRINDNCDEEIDKNSEIRSQVFLNNYGPTNACWANLSFFYTGLFTLYADISSLSKFAMEYKMFDGKPSNDLKMLEHERNSILVRQWSCSPNGEIAVIEACKYLTMVNKHEETINTYSHVPPSVYIATIIIWSFETSGYQLQSRDIKKDPLDLSPKKYFDKDGEVIHEIAQEKALNYLELISKHANESCSTEEEKNEEYKLRQMCTVGVVCYALYLLRHCKWPHDINIVRKLEHIVKSYE